MTLLPLAASAWLAWASLGAQAADTAAPPPGGQWLLDAQALHGRYQATERLGGVVLNQDRGHLTGAGLAVAVAGATVTGRLTGRRLQGDIAYRGLTQLGLPLRTETRLDWQDWQVWIGPTARLHTAAGSFGAALGAGELVVGRDIRATARSLPVTETLRLGLVSAGGDWQWRLPGGVRWQAGLQWHHAHARRLVVDAGTVLDPYDLAPRRAGWATATAGVQWPLTTGLDLVATLEHGALQVTDAPARVVYRQGQPAGLSSYPGSRQRLQTLSVGLRLAL